VDEISSLYIDIYGAKALRSRRALAITIMAEIEQSKFSVPANRGNQVKQVKRGRQYLKLHNTQIKQYTET